MIKYALKCADDHRFEGWFGGSDDFDAQKAADTLSCPVCGSSAVQKDVMAPAVATSRRRAEGRAARGREIAAAVSEAAARARQYVEKNFDDVGKRFPEEARKIHYGETAERGIYGIASPDEARELKEEGVEIAPLPTPPASPEDQKRKLN